MDTKLEIMNEILALLRNEIADIIQDEYVREMNHLVHEEARRCCEGCETESMAPVRSITIV